MSFDFVAYTWRCEPSTATAVLFPNQSLGSAAYDVVSMPGMFTITPCKMSRPMFVLQWLPVKPVLDMSDPATTAPPQPPM